MSNTIVWQFDLTVVITSFTLKKSTDQGQSFAALTSVAFNTARGAANWDDANKRFTYTDGTGNPGDVYQVIAIGANGTSMPALIVAPPTPPATCLVIGYVLDAFGAVDAQIPIVVTTVGTRGEQWGQNTAGIVAQNPMSVGMVGSNRTIYPDRNGMWKIALVQKTYARIVCAAIGLDWSFEVPVKAGPVNVRDIPQLRGQALSVFGDMNGSRNSFPNS